jgi:lipoprotein NlpD
MFMPIRLTLTILTTLLLLSCAAQGGVYHTVKSGQTLYRISKTYGVDELYLARINRVDDPTQLKIGQQIFIPDAPRLLDVPVVVTRPVAPPSVTKPAPRPAPPSAKKPSSRQPSPPERSSRPVVAAKPAISEALPPAVKGTFLWPLRGKVVRSFGQKTENPCKGLEIAAAPNTPVVSAAAGRVIYSGDGIRGFGNLIILKHDDSFFTVYGYNQKNLVEAGAFVSKGQKIAASGTPPGGGIARLYFEIRHGKAAVNPIFYLP